MRNAEKAFFWITDTLERGGIPYRIFGGFAARVYGVDRGLADIDIEVRREDTPKMVEEVAPYIVFGPARCKDENWDLELITLQYEGQEIDIAESGAKIFNQERRMWEEYEGDVENVVMKEIFGKKVPVQPLDSLISCKLKLSREVDQEDVRQLNKIKNKTH